MAESLEGRNVGKYHDLRKIGQGGMGVVYHALDTSLDREVALKVLRPDLAADSKFLKRLQDEAKLAAKLKHENVVIIWEVARTDDVHYISMDYIDGRTLREIIKKERSLNLDRIVHLFGQLAASLACAHDTGLIHRDVKPANVMVDEHDHVTLTDFGIAKATEYAPDLPGERRLTGTLPYMSPEQSQGQNVDHRTDIYSLGIVLYEMLTGRVPFRGKTTTELRNAHVHKQPPPPRKIRPEIPPAVERVVLKALEKKPRDRFQSAMEMATALRWAAEGSRIDGPPDGGNRSKGAPKGLLIGIACVSLVAVLGALLIPWISHNGDRISGLTYLIGSPQPTVTPVPVPTVTAITAPSPSPSMTKKFLETPTTTPTPTAEPTGSPWPTEPTRTPIPTDTHTPIPVSPTLTPTRISMPTTTPAPTQPPVGYAYSAPTLLSPKGDAGDCSSVSFSWTWNRTIDKEAKEYFELIWWNEKEVRDEHVDHASWSGCPGDAGNYHWTVRIVKEIGDKKYEDLSPLSIEGTFSCTGECGGTEPKPTATRKK